METINFLGNTHFSDSALRDVIQTVESAWYRFATSADTYDPDRLTFDRELLRRFYLANGYVDFRVISAVAELTPDRSGFIVTFSLEEGERYRVTAIDIESRLRDLRAGGPLSPSSKSKRETGTTRTRSRTHWSP